MTRTNPLLDDARHAPQPVGRFDGEPVYLRDGMVLRCARWFQDYNSFRDVRAYASLGVQPGDVVLDLGANIGAYPYRVACPDGAARVVCLEPEPRNFRLLRHNTRDLPVECRELGVSATGGETPLFLSRRSGMGHSTFIRRGHAGGRREATLMQTVTLDDLVDEVRPDVIKVDVEGAEYELGLERLPMTVRGFAVELHFLNKPHFLALAQRLVADLAAAGFASTRDVNVSGSNWNPVAVFLR